MVLNPDQLRERHSRYLIHHRVDTLTDQVLANLSVYNNFTENKHEHGIEPINCLEGIRSTFFTTRTTHYKFMSLPLQVCMTLQKIRK